MPYDDWDYLSYFEAESGLAPGVVPYALRQGSAPYNEWAFDDDDFEMVLEDAETSDEGDEGNDGKDDSGSGDKDPLSVSNDLEGERLSSKEVNFDQGGDGLNTDQALPSEEASFEVHDPNAEFSRKSFEMFDDMAEEDILDESEKKEREIISYLF